MSARFRTGAHAAPFQLAMDLVDETGELTITEVDSGANDNAIEVTEGTDKRLRHHLHPSATEWRPSKHSRRPARRYQPYGFYYGGGGFFGDYRRRLRHQPAD